MHNIPLSMPFSDRLTTLFADFQDLFAKFSRYVYTRLSWYSFEKKYKHDLLKKNSTCKLSCFFCFNINPASKKKSLFQNAEEIYRSKLTTSYEVKILNQKRERLHPPVVAPLFFFLFSVRRRFLQRFFWCILSTLWMMLPLFHQT